MCVNIYEKLQDFLYFNGKAYFPTLTFDFQLEDIHKLHISILLSNRTQNWDSIILMKEVGC